ncbi:nuclear transport factor 2 family protein [Silvimonas amylolytica]|uniref:SnoaL-like domain-containing protein n=1 Tax=Silvimonas amylolytica TaxID=449663 RepID=A0ABQ2PIR9_9NEIS|nr:nuclear transport factor 2 family protein [Silvimonas amylolytica]GGP25498.1 hypothetical protein GCM10010971_13170 [Silvimonas amylolytica]
MDTARLADRQAIADLMTGWMFRDLGQWDKLRGLFHADGRIEITWFDGLASDFVDASARMGKSDLRTKHVVAAPTVTFHGNRAIVETNALILGENVKLGLGCTCYSRFYDQVEQRDGVWGIVQRHAIYDLGTFNFPRGVVEIDLATLDRYPREYAALAYLLDKSGFPVENIMATHGSDKEKELKDKAGAWLRG